MAKNRFFTPIFLPIFRFFATFTPQNNNPMANSTNHKLNRITIEQLSRLGRSKVLSYQGQLVISNHISQEYLFEEPCRIDAVLILVVVRGRLDFVVNLEQGQAYGPCVLVNMPENIIQFKGSEGLEAYAVLFSPKMHEAMPYDMMQITRNYLSVKHYYNVTVKLDEIIPLVPFYQLINTALSHTTPETDDIVKSLFQAFLLSIISLMREHQPDTEIDRTASRGSRLLFERFMDLLTSYHQQERTVQFYADKLCVTPKYLSMAIKDYSGKSPSEWICDFVIAEAKSLLHYSQLSVQEVAYHLNFPTQSSFGKFFKQKTGCSPMQYISNNKYQYSK